jgi:enterochelin esterase family protein
MSKLLERVKAEGNPLLDIANGENCWVTFVWEGAGPALKLAADFTWWGMNDVTLEETEPGVWSYTCLLPVDAYVEYGFYLKPDIIEHYPDPYNPRLVWNGIDGYNNFFGCPDYKPSELKRHDPSVKRGAISTHYLPTDGLLGDSHRQLFLYHPPVDYPVPLLVVWDGMDYLYKAWLNTIVDNLIARGQLNPVAMALVLNGNTNRTLEYGENDVNLVFLLTKILPFAKQHLNLLDEKKQPGVHGLMGASRGGLTSLYLGLRAPHIFGKVLSQSGAFRRENLELEMAIFKLVREGVVQPLKIWQETGNMEVWVDGNRMMYLLLKEKGYDVTYREFNGGHNYTIWSDYLHTGLIHLFGSGVDHSKT